MPVHFPYLWKPLSVSLHANVLLYNNKKSYLQRTLYRKLDLHLYAIIGSFGIAYFGNLVVLGTDPPGTFSLAKIL